MKAVILILALILPLSIHGQHQEMVPVTGGVYTPLYGTSKEQVQVADFFLDAFPVSHAAYLDFVKKNPEWRKSEVKRIFADERYLDFWDADFSFPESLAQSPVNHVSWFAAQAYCECQGKRLPTVDEWEFAAMASENQKDARRDSLFNLAILHSYEKPKTYLMKVGTQSSNVWGIYDLHGMVWEWTLDFNAIILTGESRNYGNTDRGLFCASGALGANDLMNYAAFMRYAMRSSLKARSNLATLGFRCARDMHAEQGQIAIEK
ncbi:Formylglycine-generating enzyme, required for sulfatase activity, contains SUMF1/FGE domain [Cyclobacterium lianum]|uniref:Formylglycine-generating enzyme, required for sulfatase activity, contains SUMF1/FGE domain n=1 Tax=Cyclobacterium lianum TaxID=388280 RepID=A0A1M7Q586_9BACT|nr:formylglycine-generating enzyme family protein [Cyclobacterium lianum]SHN25517.1 Formylglycine-generating enzyme, required for sulfatase activity, contains SUMF1/FGE domain [Cyclobacterium lianum]